MLATKRSLSIFLMFSIASSSVMAQALTTTSGVIAAWSAIPPLSTAAVLARISDAPPGTKFDITSVGLAALKSASVDESVIIALIHKNAANVTNQTIIDLTSANIGTARIIDLVRFTELPKFDTTVQGMANLTAAGVDGSVQTAIVAKVGQIVDPDEDLPVLEALNARLTAGVIIGNGTLTVNRGVNGARDTLSSPQFGQASSYMAFEVQPLWKPAKKWSHLSLSPIVNVRLTTIGVAGTAGTNANFTAAGNEYLASQKAVQFQFGGVFEYHHADFKLGKANMHWAIGGIGRYMPQSITDSQRATRIWNLHDDLFEAHTLGVRLSLYKQHEFASSARWRPAAYIDFSRGTFENYETADVKAGLTAAEATTARGCLDDPPSCFSKPPSKDLFQTTKGSRSYIEARVMLKYIYLGFDINSGSGRDDVRFIGGVTVTLDKFFKVAN